MEPHANERGGVGPRYTPFTGGPESISMGLRPLHADAWLEPDVHRDDELAAKRMLLRSRHADVVASMPLGDAASAEVLELVAAEVLRLGLMTTDEIAAATHDDGGHALHPIDAAGRLVQEDLCVMVRDGVGPEGRGRWILAAASVCAPSRWRLADKVGTDLAAIHGPVPDYASIERSTDLIFDRISVHRPVWRTNWTLLDDAERFQPQSPRVARELEIDPAEVVLRVERQTLRRLPRTEAVLFTIRTYVDHLGTLSPAARDDLRGTLAQVRPELIDYRGWHHVLPAVRDWLAGA